MTRRTVCLHGHFYQPPRENPWIDEVEVQDSAAPFHRAPEGIWLPETAADLRTLQALAAEGLRFTVLSPYQCTRVRAPGGEWMDARGARFDPTRPYRIKLPSGSWFNVFFYDGPIARAVAFGEALSTGDDLVHRLEGGFSDGRGHDEALTVAVDGETFGHHRKGGDEVLAAAIRKISQRKDVQLVNLAQALDMFPPAHEAEIVDGASWSCAHGIERWRSDCGCTAGSRPGWRQHWRAPLRAALDSLRDRLADL